MNLRPNTQLAGELVKPGISTEDINRFVHEYTLENGAVPAFGLSRVSESVCTSINEVVPRYPIFKEILNEGDIVNIDVTISLMASMELFSTYFVGRFRLNSELVEVTGMSSAGNCTS